MFVASSGNMFAIFIPTLRTFHIQPDDQMFETEFRWIDHNFWCFLCSIHEMNFFQCLIIINLSLWGGHGERHQTSKETPLPLQFSCFRLEFLLLLLTKSKTSTRHKKNIFREILSDDEFLFGVSCDGSDWGGEDFLCFFISWKSQFLVTKIISAQGRPETKRKLERPVNVCLAFINKYNVPCSSEF